ncbi:phosphoglycerate kinase [Staphylococcus aureus]|nr:phosphoglycerate kinase [Staphylococcus aureus]
MGISLLEEDKIDFAKDLLEKHGDKIVLPVDTKVAKEFSNDAKITVVPSDSIPADQEGMDIGPNTVKLFADEFRRCAHCCMEWTYGCIQFSNFAQGTIGVCKQLQTLKMQLRLSVAVIQLQQQSL